ncbi:MAG: hypothetical protein ACFFDT_33995 [Candidatus Hodarchaeota archaeon]
MQYFCPISEYQQRMSTIAGEAVSQNRINQLPSVIRTAITHLVELSKKEIVPKKRLLLKEQLINNFLNTLLIAAQHGIDLETHLNRLILELESK